MPGSRTVDAQTADALPAMVWSAGPDRLCRWVNRRWLELTGRSLGDELDHGWAQDVHPEDRGSWMEAYRAAFGQGRAFTLKYRLRDQAGRYREVLEQGGPLHDGQAAAAFVGVCIDLSDLADGSDGCEPVTERERKAAAEAQAAHRMKDDFLAVLSHSLRTPLNTIMMAAQLLGMGNPDNAEVTEAVETILESVKTQTHLIERLLDISRIISGRITLAPEQVDLAGVAEAALAEIASAAGEKQVAIEAAIAVRPAIVQADPARVRQILSNLLSNAVRFTPAGGKVVLSLESADAGSPAKAGGGFKITVSDTGEGIPPEVLPVVFDPSRPRDSSRPRPRRSLGLGLAVVQRLVELHGGTVQAFSEGAGKGARFVVTLGAEGSQG